jgi:hypothetical protein
MIPRRFALRRIEKGFSVFWRDRADRSAATTIG